MTMPNEVRIGSGVTDAMRKVAEDVAGLVHAQIPLSSARIYRKSDTMYYLTVVPEQRTTLVKLEFRMADKTTTRAEAVIALIRENMAALDKADIRNALPLKVERAVAVYTHICGDGSWFRTAVRHAGRRTHLGRDGKGVVPAWSEVCFSYQGIMRPEGDDGIRFVGSGTPGLVGMKLTLPAGTRVLRSLDNADGVPVDELVDHPMTNGAGLIAKKAWKSEKSDRALGRISFTLMSDPMDIDEAAGLVDALRARNNIVGISYGRTEFRARDEGYDIPQGCPPEKRNKRTSWDDLRIDAIVDDAKAEKREVLPNEPNVTRERKIELLAAFIQNKGLERAWIDYLIDAENQRKDVMTPKVTLDRQETAGRRYNDVSINITPWLLEADVDEIIQLVGLNYEGLREGSDDLAFLDDVCNECADYRNDQDDDYHIDYPDSWSYNVWAKSLRGEVLGMLAKRRPDIHSAVQAACLTAEEHDRMRWAA